MPCRWQRATNCWKPSLPCDASWPAVDAGNGVMRIQRLQTRIIVFFVALLALVQVAAFWIVNATNSSNAHAKVEEELNVGQRVFARLLQQNADKLKLSARVLAADFAFREAIATHENQ